jgi:GTP-binding protein
VSGDGVPELMAAVAERLKDIPRLVDLVPTEEHRVYTLDSVDDNAWEASQLSAHHYEVQGRKVERMLKMTDFLNEEAAERFQRILEGSGISKRLEGMGIQPGDIVHIADAELIWDEAALEAERLVAGQGRRRTHKERLRDSFGEEIEAGKRRRQRVRKQQTGK